MTTRIHNDDSPVKGELELKHIDIEYDTSPCKKDLALSEKKSVDSLISDHEYIDYDEALHRAGGFGAYQVIMFMALSILSVYGDTIIFNFVYLTSPYKQNCQF